MLDFSRIDFNKAIRTSVRKPVEIHSKYPIVKLSSVVEIISGGTPDTKVPEYWGGDIPWLSVADFNNGNRFVKTAEKHITQKGLENSNARFLNVGDKYLLIHYMFIHCGKRGSVCTRRNCREY